MLFVAQSKIAKYNSTLEFSEGLSLDSFSHGEIARCISAIVCIYLADLCLVTLSEQLEIKRGLKNTERRFLYWWADNSTQPSKIVCISIKDLSLVFNLNDARVAWRMRNF